MRSVKASIVTYYPDLAVLRGAVVSACESTIVTNVVIVDNGGEKRVADFAQEMGCEYVKPRKNVGFGSAHNLAIQRYGSQCDYFLILNPDVTIHPGCIDSLVALMEKHPEIILSAPKILNPDGTIQRVHKRLPSFRVLMGRRFFPRLFNWLWPHEFEQYILGDCDLEKPYYIPNVSGCFMFFRSSALLKLGGFDERYFMYQEDADLSRRAHLMGSVVYWPQAVVTHLWARGSHKKWKLTWMNIVSVLKYFMKWGFDNKADVKPFID